MSVQYECTHGLRDFAQRELSAAEYCWLIRFRVASMDVQSAVCP